MVSGVSKQFDDREVVKDLALEVERGQIFGLIGPSGCGKTTTIRLLLGVLKPTEGELLVLGRRPDRFRRRDRERLGYMPQLFVLFPELSVLENMNFAASIYGVGWFGRGKKIRAALDFVELWDARKRPASDLSGGMQRRLELAATLVHDPELTFLDEPTAGVDPVLRAKFWDHFRALRDRGRTLVVTTQYVTEAEYCDQIAILKDGRLVAVGPPEQIRHDAIGGEVVHVAGADLARAELALRRVQGVRDVGRAGNRREGYHLEIVVEDAGRAIPEMVEAFRAEGVDVDQIEEQHASFDDVFVRLMEDTDARAA